MATFKWPVVDATGGSLIGKVLDENAIIVGDVLNVSNDVNTSSVGDILASVAGGLAIKSDVIVNADIKTDAAIAVSKLAALTVSRAVVSSATGVLETSATTAAEIGYVSGVTSAIQTQLNGKEPTLTKGNLTEATSSVLTVTGGTAAVIGSGTTIQVKKSSNTQDGYIDNADFRRIAWAGASGLLTGGVLSINADPTKFDVAAGTGVIYDNYTNPNEPVVYEVSWGAILGTTPTGLLTQGGTGIAIDKDGVIQQAVVEFTPEQRRKWIPLGTTIHTNRTIIDSVIDTSPNVRPWDMGNTLSDMGYAVGPINTTGNVYSANGANLKINKSAGEIFQLGSGTKASSFQPNKVTTSLLTQASFNYLYKDGAGGWTISAATTDIVPGLYDNGTGTLATVLPNRWSIQHIYFTTPDKTFIQYGQTTYGSRADAEAALTTELFDVNPELALTFFRAHLIVRSGATVLNALTSAKFVAVGKFGDVSSVGNTSTTNLQGAYDNSTEPEIILDSTHLALSIADALTPITGNLFEVCNNDKSVKYLQVSVADGIVATNITDSALTASRAVVSDANKKLISSATTAAEIGYVSGVTSAIQTQLNAMAPFKADWITADGAVKTITHNLNSLDVMVQIYDKADGATVVADVVRTGVNAIQITASAAPGASGYRVLIKLI